MIEKFGSIINIIKVLIKKDRGEIEKLVDSERIKRDEQRLKLDDSFYDIIIDNNGSIDDLKNQIYEKIVKNK